MRLIDGDKLLTNIEGAIDLTVDGRENAEAVAKTLQTILNAVKTAPEHTGKWEERYVEDENPFMRRRFYCSACGDWQTYGEPPFCPMCGAKMKKQKPMTIPEEIINSVLGYDD